MEENLEKHKKDEIIECNLLDLIANGVWNRLPTPNPGALLFLVDGSSYPI
jgi:hypothetical protein